MWRIIKHIARHVGVSVLAVVLFLAGFPTPAVVEYIAERVADRNVVDTLYHAQKDPNVLDKGFAEFVRPRVERAHAATFSMQTGYYIGNATDNRTITGLGFSPDLVLLKDNTTAGSDGVLWRSSTMTGETTARLGEAEAHLTTNAIQSLNADGFTLGTSADVNSSNIMHYWAAFDGSDCSASGTFCVGSYTGNGTTQSPSTGFQPDLVIVKGPSATQGVWRSSSMTASTTNYFSATAQDAGAQMIQSLNATSFSVGNSAVVNTNASVYHFVAFKQVSGAMDVGTYTGNAGDSRNITSTDDAGLTFQPDFVFIKNINAATAVTAALGITENYGDRSFFPTDAASAANNIQELRSAGGFEVGTASNVNGSGNALHYAAFAGAPVKTPGTGDFDLANGTYTGTGGGFSITGLGFAPDLVVIKHNDQTTDQHAVWRSRVMVGDITNYFSNAATTFAGGITALGSDGFTIGTNATVNTSGDTYYWTAFGNAMEPDLSGGSSNFLIGVYIGDAQDSTNVEHLPIEPDFVAVKRVSTTAGNWRTANQSGDLTLAYAAAAQAADILQSLRTDGFQKGANAGANSAGSTYHYFAFSTSSRFSLGTYTGSGTTKVISDAGFQPDHVWIKKTTGGTARGGVLRTSAQAGDTAQPFLASPTIAGGVTSMQAGGFTVNNAVETNENTFAYQYAAWDGKKYTQQAFRFFANADSTDVGAALAAADTAAVLSSAGDAFRLRMLVRVDNATLLPQGENFKLQFVGKGGGSCASPSGGTPSSYTDVTAATIVAYNNNGSVADGAALTLNANDPTDGGRTIVNQSYEELNNFSSLAGSTIPKGQDGKWDFALFDNGAAASTAYCFRIVESDGTVLPTYTTYPQVTTAAGGNSTPTVASVSIDSAAASVTLIEGTTKNVVCAGTVTDTNGFADIDAVEGLFFRTGVGTSSVDDNNNKYTRYGDSQCVPSGGSGNTETYTCTSSVWHYADATDAGSPNSADTWTCEMRASDGTATSTAGTDTIEMASLIALDVDSAIDYGTMAPGSGNTSETVTVTNTGNRDMDPQLSGTNMTSGGDTIAVGQQGYKTFAFSLNCGEGTDLSGTPTAVDITLPQRTSESTAVTDTLFWCLDVPNGSPTGSYGGTNTFTAAAGL